MVRNVQTVDPNMTVKQAVDQVTASEFHGFPVAENGYLLGFITAKELLRYMDQPNAKIRNVMKKGTFCAIPSMSISDATRILFRYGLRNLPVVDEDRKLIGIISNLDIVRSQIEKSRPNKVMTVKRFLEQTNDIKLKVENKEIEIDRIIPTQKEIFMDELVGRQYELDDFQIRSVAEGREAMGEAVVRLRFEGKVYSGRGISRDIVGSSLMAYLNAVNKMAYEEGEA